MPVVVHELIATDVALANLAARRITVVEAAQTLWSRHAVIPNRRGHPDRPLSPARQLLIGRDEAGRPLTLVIEATLEPTTWMLITGWESTATERRLLG